MSVNPDGFEAAPLTGDAANTPEPSDLPGGNVPTGLRGPFVRARMAFNPESSRPARLLAERRRRRKHDRHKRVKVAFFRYCYYEPAFKYFVEQVLDADFLPLPAATKQTSDLGAQHSTDYVCTPFKHILGDFIEALEAGADVLVQFGGPCRLGYYGELQESILRDMGYDFDMLNFSGGIEGGWVGWARQCIKVVNPDISVPHAVPQLLACGAMVAKLDEARDFYLANAGFEVERGSFHRAWERFLERMNGVVSVAQINETFAISMDEMRQIPVDKPDDPVRIGIVGEMFTAIDARSNLGLDEKLTGLGTEVHRALNLTNRFLRYNEPNLRVGCGDYVSFDMGPTSTLTIATARKYAQAGFDGLVHAKSAGCTPEIDCMPVLQRIGEDFRIPVLYLTYDSQTSDTGLDTRLEAFNDMLCMKKEKIRR